MFPDGVRVLVWDMDGVLFYVRNSYRRAIVESVQYYFSGLIGIHHLGPLVAAEDTQRFKYLEGFNDDWKLTYALVLCFLCDLVRGRTLPVAVYPDGLAGSRQALMDLGAVSSDWVPSIDLQAVVDHVKVSGKGLFGVEIALAGLYGRNILEAAKRFWYTGIIKRIFQELYLGEELYRLKYSEDCAFFHVPGYIRDETALVSSDTLKELGSRFYMGIASGREHFEMEYSLKLHGFESFFPEDCIVSSDDVQHGKPDPESLLLCRKRVMKRYGLMDGDARAAYGRGLG